MKKLDHHGRSEGEPFETNYLVGDLVGVKRKVWARTYS